MVIVLTPTLLVVLASTCVFVVKEVSRLTFTGLVLLTIHKLLSEAQIWVPYYKSIAMLEYYSAATGLTYLLQKVVMESWTTLSGG